MPQVVCKTWNVKILGRFKTNVKMQTTAVFASNLAANVCLMLAI